MKKVTMAVAALVLAAMPAMGSAQTASGTVSASGTITAVLSVTATNPLSFGSAISPSAGTVTIATGAAPGGAGQTLGSLGISHNSDFSTAVTSADANLTNGTDNLPITFNCAYSTSATGAIVAGTAAACSAMANRAVTTLGTTQTTFLQVGGVLTVPAGVAPGNYTGSIAFLLTATGF